MKFASHTRFNLMILLDITNHAQIRMGMPRNDCVDYGRQHELHTDTPKLSAAKNLVLVV